MNQKAKQILQKADVDKLPSLPHVLLKFLEICHDDSLSYDELAATLLLDPGLYTQFFSVCHQNQCDSILGGVSGDNAQPEQLPEKLQQLGTNTVKSIAVTATVHQFFSRTSGERTDFLKQHWYHSLYCADVARSIAVLCGYSSPAEAYSAGLLHDIGQLVLETAYPDKYTTTFAQLSEDDYFHTLELDEFGTTHQEVGAELLREHGASSFICDAVLYHHERVDHILDAHPLVKITSLANAFTSNHFNQEDEEIFDAAEQLLGLDKNALLEILDTARERVDTTAQSMAIQVTTDGMDGETTKQHNAGDEFKQIQLAEQVRNIALLDGIHQHLSRSTGQHELLNIIAQHACLLFGINQCILFLYDSVNDKVNAISADNQPAQLADLSIPLRVGRSLVTDALLNRQMSNSFDEDVKVLSIIDRQLIGITGKEGIVCLPMLMDNSTVGTLVLGADITQFENLQKQRPLLMRFINEVAHTISANDISDDTTNQSNPLEQKIREVLHEVRNPLSIINNYLEILGYKLENDRSTQEDVQTIKTELQRINAILNRLTEDDSASEEKSPTDINAIISDLSNMFQTSLFEDKNIQISLDLDERIESLLSNANALKQIYTNLVKNAVEALPANGEIMVYTQDNVNVDGIQHIELSVSDDGPGIDASIMPHLFSPIATTKGGDHAGLGLSIVKNLVNELQGSISCRSSNKGTSFHILLPK